MVAPNHNDAASKFSPETEAALNSAQYVESSEQIVRSLINSGINIVQVAERQRKGPVWGSSGQTVEHSEGVLEGIAIGIAFHVKPDEHIFEATRRWCNIIKSEARARNEHQNRAL